MDLPTQCSLLRIPIFTVLPPSLTSGSILFFSEFQSADALQSVKMICGGIRGEPGGTQPQTSKKRREVAPLTQTHLFPIKRESHSTMLGARASSVNKKQPLSEIEPLKIPQNLHWRPGGTTRFMNYKTFYPAIQLSALNDFQVYISGSRGHLSITTSHKQCVAGKSQDCPLVYASTEAQTF